MEWFSACIWTFSDLTFRDQVGIQCDIEKGRRPAVLCLVSMLQNVGSAIEYHRTSQESMDRTWIRKEDAPAGWSWVSPGHCLVSPNHNTGRRRIREISLSKWRKKTNPINKSQTAQYYFGLQEEGNGAGMRITVIRHAYRTAAILLHSILKSLGKTSVSHEKGK